jgi:hypothetical protein
MWNIGLVALNVTPGFTESKSGKINLATGFMFEKFSQNFSL